MRILVVHPRMSVMGGGERVAIHSILAGLKAGHRVSLVSEEFDAENFEDFFGCEGLFAKVDMITYTPFQPFVGKSMLLLYQRMIHHSTRIRKVLSTRIGFDLVVGTQDIGYVPNVPVPIIQYCYFPEYFSHLEARPSSRLWKLYYWPARRFYRNRVQSVGRFIAVSDYTRDFVMRKWGRDSETLYPPCPVETYSSVQAPKENIVITVGRIVPEKRMHLFVELARRLPHYKFLVVGSIGRPTSAYSDSLVRNAPDNVSFVLSPLKKETGLLAKAKVYVHCAQNEHFGITIVEAMAAGCVPVVHNSGGPKEIVSDDVGFRWSDLDEAAGQVRRAMEDDELRQSLSRAAVAKSVSYRPEVFESRLARVYAEYED